MKAIMVMYDSLNRRMLEPYGCGWIKTPNFTRLAQKAVTFDNNYAGSLPCMPARRELHTGRYNFLHRGWGPMEPYDDSMPEILKNNGIYSHLISDHYHYWEDGGCTYHSRYSSWECVRGQEGDAWKATPELIEGDTHNLFRRMKGHNAANRTYMDCEEKMPQAQTFRGGLEFLERNWQCDNWFLQIETFDPHEPFFSQPEYKKLYAHEYNGPMGDWPPYNFVTEGQDSVEHMRREYAALMTMCDTYLGKVLDFMDKHDMWKDTMLIVNTDHGYLLGEHGWWSKSVMPVFNEIANTPLFLWDPRVGARGCRRSALTQTIDLPATILDFFDIPLPKDMQGKPLRGVMENDTPIRDYALFGYHEMHMNVTDGHWVYMRAPADNDPALMKEYTLMPMHKCNMFSTGEMKHAKMVPPFRFTKECPLMQIPQEPVTSDAVNFGSRLYHLDSDPNEETPVRDDTREARLANAMVRLMEDTDCPEEYYRRFGLSRETPVTEADIAAFREKEKQDRIPDYLAGRKWTRDGSNAYYALVRYVPEKLVRPAFEAVPEGITFDSRCILQVADRIIPGPKKEMLLYVIRLNSRCN